jgi:tetratricopeptide (TPR) repeat protein
MRICNEILNEKIDVPEAIFLIGHCLIDSGKFGLAHTMYMQFLRLKPNTAAAWNNLGRCYQECGLLDEAERCFKRALKLEPEDSAAMANLGLIHLHRCEPELSIRYTQDALKITPHFKNARFTLAMAKLMNWRWGDAWEDFEATVGYDRDRKERVYGDEPRWDGTKGRCVVAYGEQGLGDEISFGSCIPDLVRDCSEAVIECDSRLKGLFQRSFPNAKVYGTRFSDVIDWADAHKVDGRVAFGSLPKYYRTSAEAFPGTPYLVADPERRTQWRALLDSLGPKPKIGIAWQGGSNKTGKSRRSVSLESLLPLLRQDATFISLQYKDPTEEIEAFSERHGIKIHHWKRAAEAVDYDETAALVSELDMVVSVTTAVIHLSGALGVPCLVLTPKHPRWFYGLQGDTLPWYKSVQLIRQKKANDWLDPINEAAVRVRTFVNGNHELHESCRSAAAVA